MAKNIIGITKITLDTVNGVYEAITGSVSISSTDGGETHDLVLGNVQNLSKRAHPKTKEDKVPRVSGPVTQTPVLSPEAERMVRAAKDNERAKLDAAAGLLEAQREAQQTILDAEHRLNRAMLDFFHTGKSDLDADEVLAEAGFTELEERTGRVYNLDTEVLYPSAE